MKDNTIRFCHLRGRDNSVLTKQYRQDDSGGICKISAPNFACGTAETKSIDKLSDIEREIENLGTNECLSTGIFDNTPCEIVTAGVLDGEKLDAGVRSRTKKHMVQPSKGIVLLDHDTSPYMPDHLGCNSPGALMLKLQKAVPLFAPVAYSGAGSCSNGITITASNEPYQGGGGLHVYIAVNDVDQLKLQSYLVVHLWTAGFGYIAFARNGAMLERSIIDLV